jgi:hypothetical protein
MAKTHDSMLPIDSRVSIDFLPANSWLRLNVPRDNQQKEAHDHEIISDREVWSAIRYLIRNHITGRVTSRQLSPCWR